MIEEEEADRDVTAEVNEDSQESIDVRGTSQVMQDEEQPEMHDEPEQGRDDNDNDDRNGDPEVEPEADSEPVLEVTTSEPPEAIADESEDEEPLVARRMFLLRRYNSSLMHITCRFNSPSACVSLATRSFNPSGEAEDAPATAHGCRG